MSDNLKTTMQCSFEEALERVPAALKEQGFGVLTEIDVKATLKKKIDVDFRPYHILGACNPPLAHQALSHELSIGLQLPCNVIVYQADDDSVVVQAVDPVQTLTSTGVEGIEELAEEVASRLALVITSLREEEA